MNKKILLVIFMFVAIVFFQVGCKKTPKCEVFFCEDEYNDLDTASKNFFYQTDTAKYSEYTNGVDTLLLWSSVTVSQIDNLKNCPSECYDTSTKFHSYLEFVSSNNSNGVYYPNSTHISIKNDSSFIPIVRVSEGHYINNGPGNYPEALPESTGISFPFSSINNYYIGNYTVYSITYIDVYKVTLNGVNIYFNRDLGLLNSYNSPDYFIIP